MKTLRRKTMVALFEDSADARRAVYAMKDAGWPLSEVSVVMREKQDSPFAESMSGSLLSLSVGNQASTTAMDVGMADLPTGTPMDVPGGLEYGPLVAAGPLAQALGGAALGVSAGGIAGALSDIGIPNDTAREIVDRARAGEVTLVCIQVSRADVDRSQAVFLDSGAATVYIGTDYTGDYAKGEVAARAAAGGR